MASKQLDPEGENEEEVTPEADFNETQYSGSSYITESPEILAGGGGGGGHPTPEDEHLASVHSMRSQELNFQHLVTFIFLLNISGSKGKEGFIPKMHRFYHMEYFLLPNDIEPRKLDLVLFGPVAKLFLDTESRVVKPWLENDQIWISWNHSIEINITNEFLIKLREHSIKLRLWDLKEKVCSKARFCKLKSSLPLSDQGEFEALFLLYLLSAVSFNGSIESSFKEKTIQDFKVIKQKHRTSLSGKHSALTKIDGSKSPSDRKERASTGECVIEIHATLSFSSSAGEYYTASRWEDNSPKLNEAYLGFAIDKPIMSEKHKRDLNPMIIKIKSAKCLPNTPVPVEELQRTCLPVYCKYTFYKMCPHYTQGRNHGTDVFFKDINVILVGALDPGEFNEYLRGPPLEIEVHDRDKKMEDLKMTPSLFGEEPEDSKLSDISTVTSRYMVQNTITAKENIHSPYGIAKINLNDLLLGEKTLNFCAPIHSCSIQDTSLSYGQNTSPGAKKTDDSQVVQLSIGHYINAESYLKVRVEISVPLGPPEEEDAAAAYCPYGCIIYLFDYNNTSLLYYLMQQITEINSEAFLLDSYPIDTTQKSLHTLKLNQKLSLEEISRLNIITGFHIIDGSIHLLILEGFRNKAIKRMWNKKIDRLHETEHGRLQIFYNSHLSFHKRLYIDLEAILLHIRLCKPLSSLMKQPLIYIRDMVPQPCFEALSRLDFICHSKKLREVVHYNLLPSSEMITTLSQEFGVPLTKADMYVREPPEYNFTCLYIFQTNIEYVNFLNEILEREIPRTIRAFPFGENAIFNYSSQTLNSAEIAKKLLQQEMAKMPGKRFAYNEYLSGMFDPVDEDSILKERIQQSKKLWLYPGGFSYPGFKSTADCNKHPRRPDEARVIELREENFFNANFMKPVLDRDRWRWDKRDADFELYRKPVFQNPAPDTHREGSQVSFRVDNR
uniref:Cilia and flagella associated protein 92 (putative) n=1 Tax=Pseudonaja textilis TaxID=8673 RepID=A0A670YMU4_PSETE